MIKHRFTGAFLLAESQMEKILGKGFGTLTGFVMGALIANYIIFPFLLGGTIGEVLQALSQ